ncbi:MAG: DUF1292 domain-containing protein [Acholeplasmatales bacterium]|nr:MAG: DUF1292 domain-containing protein [Acholeplasmatales bacterium]
MNDRTLRVEDAEGNIIDYEIVLTYTSETFKKSYVFFKEFGDSEELFVREYVETSETGGDLRPVESDEEWEELEATLEAHLEHEDES